MEGGAGGGEDGRMDYVPWVWMGWLMSVASRGCYPCSGPAGTPLGHLWSQTHTRIYTLLWNTPTQCTQTLATLCKHTVKRTHTVHTHTPHTPVTADIIINNGGTMGSRATIANRTQRLVAFTVHELDGTWPTAAGCSFLLTHLQISDWLVWRLD